MTAPGFARWFDKLLELLTEYGMGYAANRQDGVIRASASGDGFTVLTKIQVTDDAVMVRVVAAEGEPGGIMTAIKNVQFAVMLADISAAAASKSGKVGS
jgi:hypothetical protein